MMKGIDEVGAEMLEAMRRRRAEGTPAEPAADDPAVGLGRPDCPICHGLGYIRLDVPVGHPDFGKLFPCSCRDEELRRRRIEALREMSHLQNLERYTFENFEPQGQGLSPDRQRNLRFAYEAARAFARQPQGWLVLRGGYGCGKTHLAAAIANECVARGFPVLFITVPDLLDHLRAAFAPNAPQSYDERFEEVRNAPLLILDDLGVEYATPWALEKLFQLLNYRYMTHMPTVITTNRELEELDPRLRSRLGDTELVKVITILAPDYRQGGVQADHSDLDTLPLYAEMTFDSFEIRPGLKREEQKVLREALETALTYAEDPGALNEGGWLLIRGNYGTGKTHLAAAIANERVRRGEPALFVVVPDLLDHLRAAFAPHTPQTYDQRFEEVRRAPFLVLDDLGMESATPWAQEKLYQLFNYRYVAKLPTVVTTSRRMKELDAKLRIRFSDSRHCTLIELDIRPYVEVERAAAKASPSRSRGRRGTTPF